MSFFKKTTEETGSEETGGMINLVRERSEELPVDIYQTATSILIYAQVPGALVDTISVLARTKENELEIRASVERPSTFPESGAGTFSIEECKWGKYARTITVPEGIDVETAVAELNNGVLFIEMGRREVKNISPQPISRKIAAQKSI